MSRISGIHRRLGPELRERPHAALERVDLADDDLHGLIHERTVGRRVPGEHLLHRQPDRRERVLQLVGGLARERLPARHAREMDEPFAALSQLIGHAVEGADGALHFVAGVVAGSRPVSTRRDQSPAAKSLSPAVSCWIGWLIRWAM